MPQGLYWAFVEFADANEGKTRPVLYLRQTQNDYVVFRLSSQYHNKSSIIQKSYIEIKNWQSAGLSKPSWVDTVQVYYLPICSTTLRFIGQLSQQDLNHLLTQLALKNIDT